MGRDRADAQRDEIGGGQDTAHMKVAIAMSQRNAVKLHSSSVGESPAGGDVDDSATSRQAVAPMLAPQGLTGPIHEGATACCPKCTSAPPLRSESSEAASIATTSRAISV